MRIVGIKDWMTENALVLLLTLGTIFNFWWLSQFREKLRLSWPAVIPFAILHTVCGVFCVKVFAVLEAANMDAAGNMSLFGGVFFMPVAYYIAAKIIKCKVSDLFDICTICMLFTVMCARINCILTGCCQGILFGGIQGLRWPTRELEIVYYIALLICFGHKVKSGRSDGEIYPLYMISYGVFRFIIEWVRSYDGNSLIHRAHFWALISLCLGFSIYAEIEKKKTKRRR